MLQIIINYCKIGSNSGSNWFVPVSRATASQVVLNVPCNRVKTSMALAPTSSAVPSASRH